MEGRAVCFDSNLNVVSNTVYTLITKDLQSRFGNTKLPKQRENCSLETKTQRWFLSLAAFCIHGSNLNKCELLTLTDATETV